MACGRLVAPMAVVAVISAQVGAFAKGIEVNEDRITVYGPDESGCATVQAPPGTVFVSPNAFAIFVIENSKIEPKREVQGKVGSDGSFTARIPARPEDKLRIRLSSSDGGKKKLSRKVPAAAPPPARRASIGVRTASMPAPAFTPELIIRYKGTAAPKERPASAESEVLQSGVLPPE